MKHLNIRLVRETEIEQLQLISIKTFEETFIDHCAPTDLSDFLKSAYSYEKLKTEFQNEESIFYFAEYGTKIVGYLKLNWGKAQTESLEENALELERIYLLAEYQGKQIGQFLVDNAMQIAKNKKFKTIWLGVWENNLRAISFYKKNGFEQFSSHIFPLGNDMQTDILMKKTILD